MLREGENRGRAGIARVSRRAPGGVQYPRKILFPAEIPKAPSASCDASASLKAPAWREPRWSDDVGALGRRGDFDPHARLWEGPGPIQHFGARSIEAHEIVRVGGVGRHSILPSSSPNSMAIEPSSRRFGGDLVERVGVQRVRLEIGLVVIDADRSEAVDGRVLDIELVEPSCRRSSWGDVEIKPESSPARPPHASPVVQPPRRIDGVLGAEHILGVGEVGGASLSSVSRTAFWLI